MKYLIWICLTFTLIGCEPGVVFEEAMPPDVAAIRHIPIGFHGAYLCESDSGRIFIYDQLAIKESAYEFITTLDKIAEHEDCKILDGGLYLPGREECVPFTYLSQDTIAATIYDIDTLFNFRPFEVAKMYKGRLFLNHLDQQDHWITWMVSPDPDGSLLLKLIDVPDKLRQVEDITQDYTTRVTTREKVQYIINPTRVEFDRILKKEYTLECERLTPIILNHEMVRF